MTDYSSLLELTRNLADLIEPPNRAPISELVADGMHFNAGKPWDPTDTPYMIEPLNMLNSRHHDTVCFMGPVRTGKTGAFIQGAYYYKAVFAPADFAIVHSSQESARDFSNIEIARMQTHSSQLDAQRTGRKSDDNTHDKRYKSGIYTKIIWPSTAQLASRTFAWMLCTDYGRWDADIGSQGSGYVQAKNRTITFGSEGMTALESSPGSVWLDPGWSRPKFELGKPLCHEFPPTESGAKADIVPIYNNGSRCWWYVPCASCGEFYPQWADPSCGSWGDDPDPAIAAQSAGTICCWCGAVHTEETKKTENDNGRWVAEGEIIDCYGKITAINSRRGITFPSFSLGWGAAAYMKRVDWAREYLQNLLTTERTGDEKDLKAFITSKCGAPYKPMLQGKERTPHPLMERGHDWDQWVVPEGVRFLVGEVDIQHNRFEVQITGYGVDKRRWVIDYYRLARSMRLDRNGQPLPCNPAEYPEDWKLLDKLIDKSYPLADGSGREMALFGVVCDSGGPSGTTDNAYNYWRYLRKIGKHQRFRLVKGANSKDAKIVEERWPDTSGRKDIKGGSRGDVPVLYINTQRIKDALWNNSEREEDGPGYCAFPQFLGIKWFEGFTREQKTEKGWLDKSGNEPWDLMVYGDALALWGPIQAIKKNPKGIESIDWNKPPTWAAEWDNNPYVFDPKQTDAVDAGRRKPDAGLFTF